MTGNLVRVTNRTSLEALIRGNADKRRIAPNNTFNHILLQTDEWRNYSWPNNTGTGFAIEAKDKPFGKTIEKEFTYGDERKILIYHVRKEDIGASDLMNLFEHQFQDGESTIQLIDAKTEKQILTVEGLREADEIILKVVGDIRNFKLTDRNGGEFETADTKHMGYRFFCGWPSRARLRRPPLPLPPRHLPRPRGRRCRRLPRRPLRGLI